MLVKRIIGNRGAKSPIVILNQPPWSLLHHPWLKFRYVFEACRNFELLAGPMSGNNPGRRR